ncbi:hypothetical protein [Aquimarina sp. 2201CG5-10]|uniref:hypothetical protein n=1 Tax=Aquimarina callyspongiae TaxID=3098150 RepID=UPI002AB3A374|nr:hypothetical protein [Aquimarina sp. 2201CG5-10]MDY8137355.1 hypothetical protein [Aquimarina sp. 2201CG5-10]
MAFGFGPGSDMVKSVNSNRKQLAKNRSLKESHDRYKDVTDIEKPEFKKVPEKEVREFNQKFREKQKVEHRQNMFILGCVFVMVITGFYLILF